MDSEERRKFPRVSCYIGVHYKILLSPHEYALATHSADISTGGIRIFLLKNLPVGSILELELLLPDSAQEIIVHGRIAWTKEFTTSDAKHTQKAWEAGLEFSGLKAQELALIQRYVLERL